MKFYPRQSVCPHCGTVYRYADLKKLGRKKKKACYHCGKSFVISKKSYIFLALEIALLYAAVNALALNLIGNLTVFLLFAINLVPALTAVLIYPYYIELTKDHTA